MSPVKEAMKEILAKLPDEATWDDVIYDMDLRKSIEEGRNDIANGRTHTLEEAKKILLGK